VANARFVHKHKSLWKGRLMAAGNLSKDVGSAGGVTPLSIERELKTAFLDYAMSVIVSRALPDVRDGLKPVHRRILYAMHKLGYYHDKQHRKSATVVGEVIGHFHPHGDSAIYQSMVGLVQTFSKRYPLLDGQGNWGSIDGDNAAAMRYTEVRMAKIARELLADIEKETVSFSPNFDETRLEPNVLPSRIPNLLINGSTGIAVGMATSIPPHNLGEVVDACIELLKNPELSEERLFEIIPGPDLPTGGHICGRGGIVKGYRTGHGQFIMRGVVDIEEDKRGSSLVIKEIPYQVNKVDLITKIADLVKNKVVEGITNIRDESARHGIRVVIELRRGEEPQVILNQLYRHTSLQSSMSIILLALNQDRPMFFTLREMLGLFLAHRREVITKRSAFDLAKNKARAHVLDGLMIALAHIDVVISLIRSAQTPDEAGNLLHSKLSLSPEQIKAILEMRLQRLTGLEREKINQEIEELRKVITKLEFILTNENELKSEIIKELDYVKATYSNPRKTKIVGALEGMSDADLIPDEDVVVTLTRRGYIKRVLLDTYTLQHRGGKGKKGTADLEELDDVIQDLFVARTHDELLFFTNQGRIFSIMVYQVPEGTRTSKGRAIVNLLQLTENERVVKLLCTRGMENKFLVMVTKNGTIKKTDGMAFAKIRSTGIRAINLNEGDELAFCGISSGSDTVVLATSKGQGIRFKESEIRSMGRQAAGVRGVSLRKGDFVVGMEIIADSGDVLFATSAGFGKRVKIVDFRIAHRGGVGVRTIPTSERNGMVIGLVQVTDHSEVLLIDANGKIIRLSPREIRVMGRQAKGVRLVRLDKGQVLASMVAFECVEEEGQDGVDQGSSDSDVHESSALLNQEFMDGDDEVVDILAVDESNDLENVAD
jgi:DNA gyrase subunit A